MIKKKINVRLLTGAAALLAAVVLGLGMIYAYKFGGGFFKPKYEWQKGMCYATWSKERYSTKESDESIKRIAETGTEWVAIVTTWYQERCDTTKIFPTEKTPSDASLIHAIETVHSLGMKVMLKPHLDLLDTSGGAWRGEITCAPEDWDDWFNNYKDFVLHYAKLAQDNKVEFFCVGTELTSVATIKESMWRDIVIKPVRDIYKGPLTYAANWNEEYNQVKFWDALDYVGIDAYFPLSENNKPDLAEIKKSWEKWVKEIEEFQARVNMPIIFPEVGYCSAQGTAKAPWQEIVNTPLDLEQQADCYQALLETFWDKDWFYGVYWWKWGTDVRFGGPNNRGYNPQNKPAQRIVTEWYAKPTPLVKKF